MVWTPPLSFSISLSPATLTHFTITIFCCGRHLPPFLSHSRFLSSATLTHFTLFCWVYSLSVSIFSHVNRHSSDTYTTPISIYLSLSLSLSLSPANHDMSDWSLHFPYSSSLKQGFFSTWSTPGIWALLTSLTSCNYHTLIALLSSTYSTLTFARVMIVV